MTEEKLSQASPQVMADEYRRVFERAPDGILIVDTEGLVRDANPRAEEMFGYAREELLGLEVEALVPEESRESHREEREAYTSNPHARPMGIGMRLRGRRRDGSVFPVEISLSPMESAGRTFIIATVRDITERERLRQFGAEALHAAEVERRRIARELHDDTAQRLATLLLELRVALRSVEGEGEELLRGLRTQILEAAESVRRIARGLRPPSLEDAGLVAAIRGHLRQVEETGEIHIEADLEPVEGVLDEDSKLVLYRILQEAVTNALRHAEAEVVRVRLQRGSDRVRLSVRDDGVGFEADREMTSTHKLGLIGMRERAHAVDGGFDLESGLGEGTEIRAWVPVAEGPNERSGGP